MMFSRNGRKVAKVGLKSSARWIGGWRKVEPSLRGEVWKIPRMPDPQGGTALRSLRPLRETHSVSFPEHFPTPNSEEPKVKMLQRGSGRSLTRDFREGNVRESIVKRCLHEFHSASDFSPL
jgi:hypothetical protein